jgi:hypothetical protein
MNEKPPSKSSLNLTLMQHPHDEDPEPWKVRTRLEIKPHQAWYYHIFLNFHTLVILLQVDPAFGDKPKTICENCYKTENTSIFEWSLVSGIKHYHCLRSLIRRLPLDSKANYLVYTIRRILDFL